jgi:carboxypeptidase C (cathepsin A)
VIDHRRLIRPVCLAIGLAAAVVPAALADPANGPAEEQAASEAGPAAAPTFLPPPSTTRHQIEIDGRRIDYRATAGTLPVGQDLESPEAHLFYVSYAIEEADPATRPVAFVLNGGPGASAAYLHLGGLGPQRVLFEDDGAAPPPPARIAPNADTWLPFTDLVFIDPVETGFSRTVASEDGERDDRRLLGTEPDLEALSAFVRLWLSRNQRWTSPKFLIGESYGGFRVAALAGTLDERAGVQVNGAVLISPVLEFSLHDADDYTLLPWVLRVPSFAAVARTHGKAAPGAAGPSDLDAFLDEAEAFSLVELLPGLAQGDALPASATDALYRRLADLVGLPTELVRRHAGRIPREVFAKELLRADGRVLSLYDGSIIGIDPEPSRSSARRDARLTRLTAALTTAINGYLRGHLDYATDAPYRVLNREVSRRWRWGEGGQGFIGAADDLKAVLSREPSLQVLIAHGVHDLVTPYFASVYVKHQMRLDPELRNAISVELYEGGHMFYTRTPSRAELREDARILFESAGAEGRRADAGAAEGAGAGGDFNIGPSGANLAASS